MTPQERIKHYCDETGYPNGACVDGANGVYAGGDHRILGIWIMGNAYQVQSRYYGGYPHGYLKRIKALFPEKTRPLHIFSGKVDLGALPGDTVDLDASLEPTYCDDAQDLRGVPLREYDLILADPPYSVEDAEHYKPTMVKRNKVMRALGERARRGTHVVWLDQVLPMYRKEQWSLIGLIGMVKSTNHRFRVVTIFERR